MMIKRVLTVAGSDSSGGAGIQADLKTFSAFGVYGMCVVTAVTAQSTVGINGVVAVDPHLVSLQFESVLSDIGVDGAKTGMLQDAGIVQVVVRKFQESRIPHIVVDPVLLAKSGHPLLERRSIEILKNELIPLATLVTPNIPEAEIFSEMSIHNLEDMKAAAGKIHGLGCRAVLVKGGHLRGQAVDLLFDGDAFFPLAAPRVDTKNTHGTGCTLSAAITANLAKGKSLGEAVGISKAYVTEAIKKSFSLGKGHGPLNHFVRVRGMDGIDDG